VADKTVKAFLGVGSNIEPEYNILEALKRIQRYIKVTGTSTFYRTMPIGRPGQGPFLNGVWRIETSGPARTLKFEYLRRIEGELGRVRMEDKYAARTIDLDVIVYGDAVIDEPDLKIPDADIRTRPFVAVPLLELEPELVLADTGERLASVVESMAVVEMEPVSEFVERLRRVINS